MSLWRVRFSDGRFYEGWLSSDAGNGRCGVWESTEEHARSQADRENDADPETLHEAMPAKMPTEAFREAIEKLHKRARARQRRRWA